MGLLELASAVNINQKSGLLARAENINCEKKDFFSWCASNGFDHAGLFMQTDGFFCLVKCTGLDVQTIVSSVSTADFMNGLHSETGKWKTFSKEELTPLYQLFSESFKDKLKTVSFLPFTHDGKEYFFMTVSDSEDTILPEADSLFISTLTGTVSKSIPANEHKHDIEKGLSISSAAFFILSLKLPIEQTTSNLQSEIKALVTETIFDECLYIINRLFQTPNCAEAGKNYEIKIVIFSKEEIDERLLQFHISKELSVILGKQYEQSVILLAAGTCGNINGTQAFLSHE